MLTELHLRQYAHSTAPARENQDITEQKGRQVLAPGQHDGRDVAADQRQHGDDDFVQDDRVKHGGGGDRHG